MELNALQQVANQIGEDTVRKSMPTMFIQRCAVHGLYASASDDTPKCPVCKDIPTVTNAGNGESASAVSHYINPGQELGTNPGQKANPYGI